MKEWIEAAKKYYEKLTEDATWTKEYRQGKTGLDLIAEIEQLEKIKETTKELLNILPKIPIIAPVIDRLERLIAENEEKKWDY